jgi:photosystem II stability/assembly factor-like uncharacterized protein
LSDQITPQDLIYALAISPNFSEDGLCFAARSSALYRSEDGGENWQLAYSGLEPGTELPTTAVVLSPTFTTDRSLFAGVTGVVMRSSDAGVTWHYSPLASPPPIIAALAVSPNFVEDGTLLVGTMEDGLYRSEDRGMRWMACNFGLTDLSVLSIALSPNFAADDTVYVGTESGVFYSTNGGRAWKESGFPVDEAPVLCLGISPDHEDDGILWAGTESNGVFVSEDNGKNWRRLAPDQISESVNAIAVSIHYPDKADLLVLIDHTLMVSRDGGSTWNEWKEGLFVEQGLVCMAAERNLDPGAAVLAATTSGTVLRL